MKKMKKLSILLYHICFIGCFIIGVRITEGTIQFSYSLEELVLKADHIIIGEVTNVDMFNSKGMRIKNPKTTTGPGKKYSIVVTIKPDIHRGVLFTKQSTVPDQILITLPQEFIYKLEDVSDCIGKEYLFFLEGSNFAPVDGKFQRTLDDYCEVTKILFERREGDPKD